MKKILGYTILTITIIGPFIWMGFEFGFIRVLGLFGLVIAGAALVGLGIYLIDSE
jgi:hypothetical protein